MMRKKDRMQGSLQENLITLLGLHPEGGRAVRHLLTADMFEGEYRIVAERCLDYWDRHRQPPGDHLADLFADILEDPKNRMARTYRNIIQNMLALASGINAQYVVAQVTAFIRLQTLKDGILRAAEQLQAGEQFAIDEVEQILGDLLRKQDPTFHEGTRLDDVAGVLEYMRTLRSEFTFGIQALDKRNFVPYRQSASLLIGPRGAGKSWFFVNVGRRNLMLGRRVLHVSLEMSEFEVAHRYYRCMFAVPNAPTLYKVPALSVGEDRPFRLAGISMESVEPEFSFQSPYIFDELQTHVAALGPRARNLVIKSFPMRSLTVAMLEGYLELLEASRNFIPDMVLVDYAGIMHTSASNRRVDLGQAFEGLAGMADRRHFALVTAQQAGRGSIATGKVTDADIAEDISLTHTAHQILTLSRTKAERESGLARLFISKARGVQDNFGVVLAQSLGIGQFALSSALMCDDYWKIVKDLTGDEDADAEETEEDEEYDDGYG